uniref:JmjC domain-containing protein n=1 Tax=Globisporangium ultimum (strain ATCC 200006 / CBS 805.95 / DAOM BR144) TaxID=431595 RepID=K3X0B1_GLOUD
MPTESDEVDEVEGPHVMATKEVLVCKHCQREFAYASRGVARHKSECRVFQQRKMEESEAAAARQQEDENGDEDEKMAYNQDKDNEMIQSQVEDEEEATTSRGNAAADKDHKRAVTPGGDDGDDGESSLQGSTTTNASLADEKEASEESQCRTLTAQDPGFRIYHETGSKGRTKKRAECRSCGKSCAYTYMARHARACQKHAAALSQPSATPEPHATTPKRASKRRLAQEESPDEDVKQNDASADAEDDEAAEDDAVSMTTAKDVITPRRSKRIKHDPTQSPTEKEPQGDKTPKRLQVQMPRTTPPQTKKHTVEPHVSPHHPSISPAVVPEKTRVHFDMMLLEKGERLRCKYCGEEVRARPGVPDRHLQHCKEFDARHKRVLKIMQQHEDESMPGSGDELSVVVTEDTMTALSWLFGSIENADAMKSTYRRSPLCVKSPLSRFQQLIKDPLCELSVPKLLDIAPLTRPVTLFMNAQDVQPRRTVSAVICSKLEAQELYEAGASLSFPASESVKTLFVTPLVKDLGVSPLVNPAAHDTVLVCGRAGFHFEWHFHRSDCFVIQLKGKTRWKCDQDAIRDPLGDYHPFANNASPHGEENALKIYRTSAANRKLTLVPPAEGGDRMMHDADENENENRTEPLEVMAEPGCVVYMPSGTWCEADAIDNALWLEVRIAPISHGELVADAIRQLLWKDEKWRQPILASHDVRSNRQHLDSLLKDLHSTVSTLCSSDLLPETLVSSDRDVSHDANGPAERNMDVDLSKHEFKSDRYIKIFKTTGLRENPLAVILGRHEIVDRRLGDGNSDSVALPYHSGSPHRKKALVKKPERKPSAPVVRKMDHVDDNVYIVHVQYGNADLRSRLRVQFRCNAFQSALVEWIREHDGAAFHASDLMEAAQKMPGATSGKPSGTASSHQDEEATKYVLRFLCSIGYVSRVKLASERGEHRERT